MNCYFLDFYIGVLVLFSYLRNEFRGGNSLLEIELLLKCGGELF